MALGKKLMLLILLSCFCLSLSSCASIGKGIKAADDWIKEHAW